MRSTASSNVVAAGRPRRRSSPRWRARRSRWPRPRSRWPRRRPARRRSRPRSRRSPAASRPPRLRRRWSSASSRVTWLSALPSVQAKPALVVASAGKPSCSSARALPASQGFGITKHPAACRSRKAATRSFCTVIGTPRPGSSEHHGPGHPTLPTRLAPRVARVKPFLFLAIRAEDVAADEEYAAMLRCTGLDEPQLRRVRLEQGRVRPARPRRPVGHHPRRRDRSRPAIRRRSKSAAQRQAEAGLCALLDQIVPRDFPFLGACYGVGTLGRHQGAVVDRTYPEPISGTFVELTAEGRRDPLFARGRLALRGVRRAQGGGPQPSRPMPSRWPRRPPARCRRSGSGAGCTPPSSIPSSISTGWPPGRGLPLRRLLRPGGGRRGARRGPGERGHRDPQPARAVRGALRPRLMPEGSNGCPERRTLAAVH